MIKKNDALLHCSESNEKHVLPEEGVKEEIILYQPDDKVRQGYGTWSHHYNQTQFYTGRDTK